MKTFIETVSEAAWQNGDPSLSAFIKLNLEQYHLDLLQQAADMYAEQSNSHKPVVGGPVSDVRSEGEQLGNEGSAKSVRDGIEEYKKGYKEGWDKGYLIGLAEGRA